MSEMNGEQRTIVAVLLIVLVALCAVLVTSQAESTKTAALCKQAIEQKADFAIAKLCR